MQAQKVKKNTAYQVPAVDGRLDIVEFMAEHQARPYLETLCRETDETCQLQVVPGRRLYYYASALGPDLRKVW